MEEIVRFCEGYPILGHNVQFDYGFLKQNAVMCGLGFEKDGIDTLKIARKVLPDMRSRSLPAMCAHYRVDPGNSTGRWMTPAIRISIGKCSRNSAGRSRRHLFFRK